MSNRSREVDAWFAEAIKWKAPTFIHKGNLASFFPKSTKHVTLMFHTGAELPDPYGILEGDGEVARSVKIRDHEDLADKTPALRGLVTAWIESKA